ncbi:hypothetical protein ABZ119_22910 [Streptomyces sp. NPDC006288]|uniref:hypothetical protein n=1 Tax=Streptomyces sp. NPDC006288 TaxID=3156743 RepID=UPI00339F5F49
MSSERSPHRKTGKLPAPIVESLPDFPGTTQPGLIPKPLLDWRDTLEVTIVSLNVSPPMAGLRDEVQLLVDSQPVGDRVEVTEGEGSYLRIQLPVTSLPQDRTYALTYELHQFIGVVEESEQTLITVDRTAPLGLAAPSLTDTEFSLSSLTGPVNIQIPAYNGVRAGDTVWFYLFTQDEPDLEYPPVDHHKVDASQIEGGIVAELSADHFQPVGPAEARLQYRVVDLAGNWSALSEPATVLMTD